MSTRRFIELYSGSRNRNRYPLASSYVVPFASTRQILNPTQSADPLTTGPIYYTWAGGDPFTGNMTSMTGSNISQIILPVSPSVPGQTNRVDNYLGYTLTNVTAVPQQSRKIARYVPTSHAFIPDEAFTSYTAGDQFTVTDPSNGVNKIHFPAVDINGIPIAFYDNAYDGFYLVDETLSTLLGYVVASTIGFFDVTCQVGTLDTPFPGNWQVTDTYTLRRSLPQEKFILDIPNAPNSYSFFVLPNGMPMPGVVIFLPPGQGVTDQNAYAGKYVYHAFNEQLPANAPPNPRVSENVHGGGTYGLYYINASEYDSVSNRVLLLIMTDDNDEYNGTQIPNFIPSVGGAAINIVSFLRDNYCPLNYNGTMTSVNEAVCYEIALVSLIMPNTTLVTGSRLVFYPFVYVELCNISAPSGSSQDIIYSNNPPSNRALFIVPVTDTTQPIASSFMKISSPMIQVVKFKPNDSLKFSVYLPDGRLFETVQTDYLSPYPPNGRLQIEAVFGVRRIAS